MFNYGFPRHWSTLRKLLWLKLLQGAAAVVETVTGTLPLTLANALSHAIVSLTRYGLCVQDGTPTPDAPVDIMTNNGAIKVSPNLANMVSDNIVVGKYINNSGVVTDDTANFYYAPYVSVTPGGTYTMATSSSIWYFSVMQYDSSKTFLRRTIWGASNTPVGAEKTFSVGSDCAYIRFGSNMKKASISLADVLAVNWMLTQTATAQDYRPYGEIYVGGTHPGQNLVDLTAVTDGYYYDPSGVYTEIPVARLTDYIFVKAGQKYTVYVKATTSGSAATVRCNLFDSSKVWKSQSNFAVNSGSANVGIVTPSEDGFLRVSANYTGTGAQADWSKLQIVRGEYTLATMPPYEPYTEIPYTPEVLTVSGINLLDPSTSSITIGQYYNVSGTLVNGVNNWRSGLIPIVGGKTYAFCGRKKTDNTISAYNRINWYAADGTHIAPRPSYTVNTATIATAPSNAAFAGLSCSAYDNVAAITRETFDEFNWMFAEASEEIPYQPYVTPQTASVPMLLGVGNYKDEEELIHGLLTHKIGVYAFNGTEGWNVRKVEGGKTTLQLTSTSKIPYIIADDVVGLSTHLAYLGVVTGIDSVYAKGMGFVFFKSSQYPNARNVYVNVPSTVATTEAETQSWLATQYAAGTPVIVVYPLAKETTEQTTAHHLVTHGGTNIVDSTANVGPVEAKVEYMKAA